MLLDFFERLGLPFWIPWTSFWAPRALFWGPRAPFKAPEAFQGWHFETLELYLALPGRYFLIFFQVTRGGSTLLDFFERLGMPFWIPWISFWAPGVFFWSPRTPWKTPEAFQGRHFETLELHLAARVAIHCFFFQVRRGGLTRLHFFEHFGLQFWIPDWLGAGTKAGSRLEKGWGAPRQIRGNFE